jgi:hypothetical protein
MRLLSDPAQVFKVKLGGYKGIGHFIANPNRLPLAEGFPVLWHG